MFFNHLIHRSIGLDPYNQFDWHLNYKSPIPLWQAQLWFGVISGRRQRASASFERHRLRGAASTTMHDSLKGEIEKKRMKYKIELGCKTLCGRIRPPYLGEALAWLGFTLLRPPAIRSSAPICNYRYQISNRNAECNVFHIFRFP